MTTEPHPITNLDGATAQCLAIGFEMGDILGHEYATAKQYGIKYPHSTTSQTVYCPESGKVVS